MLRIIGSIFSPITTKWQLIPGAFFWRILKKSQDLYNKALQKKSFSVEEYRTCSQLDVSLIFSIPFAAKHFISCLMEKDPEKRFTCDQALQHPWWETNHTAPQLDSHREPYMLVQLNSRMTQIARITHLSCRAFPPTVICRHGSKPQNPPLLCTNSPRREICWMNGCQLVAGVLKDPLRTWKL